MNQQTPATTADNDTMANEAARTAVVALIYDEANRTTDWRHDAETIAVDAGRQFASEHAVTWEHAVNEHGVPVRRYVARSGWEVDPVAQAGLRKEAS